MSEIKIMPVDITDAAQLLDIYAYYIQNTAITFEYEIPSLTEYQKRIEEISQTYPYLVAKKDGKVVGFAYAAPFNHRAAYKWSVEVTIYLDPTSRGNGIGKKLYYRLEHCLSAMGFQNLNACISVPKKDADSYVDYGSMHFHEHLGYKLVGRFHSCGYKFDTWYDMIWMEKLIGDHPVPAPLLLDK